ncbi:restriction alleviation protein, Lar family [Acidovorax citrulli]|nr:restriction alleviation protein, Lar family [Paracidovorax citrulli]
MAPCPFCGGEPSIVERPDNIDGTEFFYAMACYCGGYSARAHQMAIRKNPEQAKADAIAAWNRRALAPAVEEYEQALALLAGLHPGLTIDGPPLEVATRIFDAVMADRAHHEQEIRRQERALESMRAHAWRRS